MTRIAVGTKELIIGTSVFSDGKVIVDAHNPAGPQSVHTNVPVVALVDAINKIDGVTASYTPPFKAENQPVGTIVRAYGQSDDNGYIKVEGGWRWIGKLDQKIIKDDEMDRYRAKTVTL